MAPNNVAFGPGGTIVIEGVDSAVRMHDLETGVLLARFEPPEVVAQGPIAIGPSGRFLAYSRRLSLAISSLSP